MTKKKPSKKCNTSSKAKKVIWTEVPKITDRIWLTRIIPSARSYSFLPPVFFLQLLLDLNKGKLGLHELFAQLAPCHNIYGKITALLSSLN